MSPENHDSVATRLLKYVVPPILVLVSAGALMLLFMAKQAPSEREVERVLPKVEWIPVSQGDVPLTVASQGVVSARRSTLLISEVSGVVEWVSPALYAGGFFEQGDPLLRVEPTTYEAVVATARSRVAQASLRHQQELALAEQARMEWQDLGTGEGTDLALRRPQVAAAAADLAAAEASLKQAEYDLTRTEIRAPYRGRVREKFVDIGQSLAARSSQVASIYSVDAVEIRVSFSQVDAGLLVLPEHYVDGVFSGESPPVRVWVDYGGETHEWQGHLDRVEGAVDAATRLIYAVVRVDAPYASTPEKPRPPLKVGMFVRVEILGRTVKGAVVLPREALQREDRVHVLDDQDRLEIREVAVIQRGLESVVIGKGLHSGDRVITTRLQFAAQGMQLDPVARSEADSPAGTGPTEP